MEAYLAEVKKDSPGSFINSRLQLRNFTKKVKKQFVNVTVRDMQNYLKRYIDTKNIKKATKNSYRYILASFFNYIQKILSSYDIDFINPVPSRKLFDFSTNVEDISYADDEELKILTLNQIDQLLHYAKEKMEFRDFILIEMAIISGARISEVRSIRAKDINLEERYFHTGFILGARKTSHRTERSLLFFFPQPIVFHLREYLESCKECQLWLFPGYKDNHLSHSMTQDILKSIREHMTFYFTWHYFRRTLISERIKKGCEKWLSKGLANHAPSDVQEKSYIKLPIAKKRAYYDEFFPYSELSFFK